MLDTAIEHLDEYFTAVGVTERFDETALAIARTMGWDAFGYHWENRSSNRVRRRDVEPAVLSEFDDRNRYDRALHDLAGARLDAALDGLDVPRELRRLARANRVEDVRARTRERVYPIRRVGGLLKRAVRRRREDGA
jgi:hypothetical protein